MADNETTAATEAAEKPAKAPKVERVKQNGVTRPKEGSLTGRVWDVADSISKDKGRPALRGEVIETLKGDLESGAIAMGTVTTQYGRWCTFYGVDAAARKAARDAEKAANAPAEAAPVDNHDNVAEQAELEGDDDEDEDDDDSAEE